MNDENNLEDVPDDEGQSIDPFDSEASDDDESSDIEAEAPVDNRKFENNFGYWKFWSTLKIYNQT